MKYLVTARSARLVCGVLLLTDAQAKPRAHNLKPLGRNRYEIINAVEFKSGEEIGYEGDLPKSLADNLTGKAEAEAAAKKAAEAEAKARARAEAEAAKAGAKALAAWEADAELRSQYGNNFDEYVLALQG